MASTARAGNDGLWLSRASYAALALYLLLAAFVLWRSAVLAPFSDEFEWIARWYRLRADHDWAAYLLAPHNQHRMVWTFALIALDVRAFGGTNLPLIVSGAAGLAVMAWALARQAAQAAPAPLKPPAAALAAMLTLAAGNVLDASTPIDVTYVHSAMFAVLAIALAEGAPQSPFGGRGAAALICAMGSALGNAAGLAVWPVLAFGAVRRGDWRWLSAVAATGLIFVGLYAHGQVTAGGHLLAALRDPASALRLALGFLALPWTRLSLGFAWIAGGVIAAISAAALATCGGRQAPPRERVACGLILFTLGAAAMAGLGRTGLEDPANAPLRYAVFVAPLQGGFLMLALPWLGELRLANRPLAQGLIGAALLAVFAQDLVMAAKVVRASDLVRETIADFHAGERRPEMQMMVLPDLARAEALSAQMRKDVLFQHELHLKPPATSR